MKSGLLTNVCVLFIAAAAYSCAGEQYSADGVPRWDIRAMETERVITAANGFLREEQVTITSFHASRSAGGVHDYYSEGDYWWPDPVDPDGPYIQKDGFSNPANFVDHRKALIRLSVQTAALTAAYSITGGKHYAEHALKHIRAWFVSDATRMNPHLLYAQAIKGRFTGRGIGIIDTIHLVEVVQSIIILNEAGLFAPQEIAAIKAWFAEYLQWLLNHRYGKDEMNAKNNHGTCWVMQSAIFAKLIGDEQTMELCRRRFKQVLLPEQMALDGSFPLELKRTKPYNYSLFNLDAMSAICQILSTKNDDLWQFTLPDGRGMKKGIEFMAPYISDKSSWNYPSDVMFFEYYPVRQPSLLFGGIAYSKEEYLNLWKRLDADPTNDEVIRNFPIRQPVLWIR
jgi:hypothetical protein